MVSLFFLWNQLTKTSEISVDSTSGRSTDRVVMSVARSPHLLSDSANTHEFALHTGNFFFSEK